MSKTEDYTDPDTLERLYNEEGLTSYEIGDRFGVTGSTIRYQMEKHGIKRRKGKNEYDHVPLYFNKQGGVLRWQHEYDGERDVIAVHQLLAIANGEDPTTIWGDTKQVVTHTNNIGWDNRPENIEVCSQSRLNQEYTDREMLEWIETFVHEFGVVPAYRDITGWPGPSQSTYEQRFGSFPKAVKAAGYTPRSES